MVCRYIKTTFSCSSSLCKSTSVAATKGFARNISRHAPEHVRIVLFHELFAELFMDPEVSVFGGGAVRFVFVALYLVLFLRVRLATTLRSPLNSSSTADGVGGRVLVDMLGGSKRRPHKSLSAHPAKVIVAVEEEMQDIRSRDPIFSTQSNLAAIPIQPITSLFNSFQLCLKKISL